ncbi:MAG: N-acetylmuramoyl-L-alanine amidase [Myxococcota bacterium]
MKRWSLALTSLLVASACGSSERAVLRGTSALVPLMNAAASEADVPAEILAAIAISETALIAPAADVDEGHAPRGYGVMGLLDQGEVRSVERGAALSGAALTLVKSDPKENIRAAAHLLRALADEIFGQNALPAGGSRDRWLIVVRRWFGDNAAAESLALEVRRNAARGISMLDGEGKTVDIPSFAALYASAQPFGSTGAGLAAEYPGATFVAANSGNYTADNRTAADIDVIVIHTVQGTYASAISWFQNSAANVSAHYVVRRSDGAITQMVRHKDIAWHAGNWSYNTRSIGIEHEGYIADANNYTPAMIAASADLSRWLCDNLGIPKDRSHIIGHVEVPSATHTDPGMYFPWSDYMQQVLSGMSPPPPTGNGKLEGVVYIGTDTTRRLPGATVTIQPGGATATARASDGYWSFMLAPGSYTITARAAGYTDNSVSRTVTAGGDEWGSVGLTPAAPTMTGTLRGVVYDARGADLSTRVSGADVALSSGEHQVVGSDGSFSFDVSPGDYTITVTKSGWTTGTNQRTVSAGTITWGSTGIQPTSTMPGNRAPSVPAPLSPIRGITTRPTAPIFTVGGLYDPDMDALSLEVELYADEAMTTPLSTGEISAGHAGPIVSFPYPNDDLLRYAVIYWRVRASDGTAASPFSPLESFVVPGGAAPGPSTMVWTAPVLPGVFDDQPPAPSLILDPQDKSTVPTTRPRFVAQAATDPEGDPVAYAFAVASDDVFGAVESEGLATADASWVIDKDLAPGATYYVRVRTADARLYSAWSAPIAFTVSTSATGSGVGPGDSDPGAPPAISATLEDHGGCSAVSPSEGLWASLVAAVIFFSRRRAKADRVTL